MPDTTSELGSIFDWRDALDPTARRIVTAARICFTENGFADTTMQRVADNAGVGVATVYRRFGHKQQLVRLAIMDESLRVATLLAEVAEHATSPQDSIVEVFAAFVHEASAPKLLTRSIRESPAAGELTDFLTDETAIEVSRTLVVGHLHRWRVAGRLPAELDLAIVGEMIARLIMSLIETPKSVIPLQDPDLAREFARTYLVPLLQLDRVEPRSP
ncbi:TetR/AcrR family transcriptional regulator [Nocardia sp. BMG111209]|uniref:TetR/AcrR family transcriptional regulator n=1 Tax=Nocardia sp. BMG111209 TaxID=1160137 RepID=UPI00035D7CF9|nr:TetR/AcrR family transcriptional regulator [Nocardia sp. BMG111209]